MEGFRAEFGKEASLKMWHEATSSSAAASDYTPRTGTTSAPQMYKPKAHNPRVLDDGNTSDTHLNHYRMIKRKRDRCIVNHDSAWQNKWLGRWDAIAGLLLVSVAIITPFETGFVHPATPQLYDSISYFNYIANVFFCLDIVLQFFLPYHITTRFGKIWVSSRKQIFTHYVRRWFLIDFISVIPFDLITPGKSLGAFRLMRLLRLFKLLKLARASRLQKRIQTEFDFVSFRAGALYVLLGFVLTAAHWIACFLGAISRTQLVDKVCPHIVKDGKVASNLNCQFSWLTILDIPRDSTDPEDFLSPWDAYLVCLHFSMAIIVHPNGYKYAKPGEAIIIIFLMLIGGFVWTQVISRSTAIRASIDRHHLQYHQNMDDISELAKDFGLSRETQIKLRKFFLKAKEQAQADTWRCLLSRMSPQLRRDSFREMHQYWIIRIPFLKHCSGSIGLITDIAEVMELKCFGEQEFFGEKGTMYVMKEGVVSFVRVGSLGKALAVVGLGKSWGEDHLLLTSDLLLKENLVVSFTFAQVQALTKVNFDTILSYHPREFAKIRKEAVRLAFVRAVKLEVQNYRTKKKSGVDQFMTVASSRLRDGASESARAALSHHKSRKYDAESNNAGLLTQAAEDALGQMQQEISELSHQQNALVLQQDALSVKVDQILSILQDLGATGDQQRLADQRVQGEFCVPDDEHVHADALASGQQGGLHSLFDNEERSPLVSREGLHELNIEERDEGAESRLFAFNFAKKTCCYSEGSGTRHGQIQQPAFPLCTAPRH